MREIGQPTCTVQPTTAKNTGPDLKSVSAIAASHVRNVCELGASAALDQRSILMPPAQKHVASNSGLAVGVAAAGEERLKHSIHIA